MTEGPARLPQASTVTVAGWIVAVVEVNVDPARWDIS